MSYDPKAMKVAWENALAEFFAMAVPGQKMPWANGTLMCWGVSPASNAIYISPFGDIALLVRGMSPKDIVMEGPAGQYLGCLWATQFGMNPFTGEFDGYAYGGVPPIY